MTIQQNIHHQIHSLKNKYTKGKWALPCGKTASHAQLSENISPEKESFWFFVNLHNEAVDMTFTRKNTMHSSFDENHFSHKLQILFTIYSKPYITIIMKNVGPGGLSLVKNQRPNKMLLFRRSLETSLSRVLKGSSRKKTNFYSID